jgi:aspartate kinase
MALIVQKYGGTSVGDLERIHFVADKVLKARSEGHDLVVVVSAMSGETDRLVSMAQKLSNAPDPREVDVLLATGEQVSIALLSMALIGRGCPACSFTGAQVHIRTDSVHNKARILGIDGTRIRSELEAGKVVVVAGFQGSDSFGNITTLGRGGSDTTAVALAAALKADECQIYTDVEGVFTADPKIVPEARRMTQMTFEEMLELSSLGAKVMQIRAVEFAGKYNIPLRVLSTFEEGPGTLITGAEENMNRPPVSGVAYHRDEAKIIVQGIPDSPGIAASILGPISAAHIEMDMFLQNLREKGRTDLAFTVHRKEFAKTKELLMPVLSHIGAEGIIVDDKVVKLSLVGIGMRSNAGIISKMFDVLGKEGINIQLVSTSEIKVSVIIDEKHLETGVKALHHAFSLEAEQALASTSANTAI